MCKTLAILNKMSESEIVVQIPRNERINKKGNILKVIFAQITSGVGFWGVEDNNIGHTMRTIIVDENLKVVKAIDGFEWKPGDAKKDIENLLKYYR